jgi:Spy/CpxP family protein refolding chaperone
LTPPFTIKTCSHVPKTGSITLLTKEDRAHLRAFKKASMRHVKKVTRTRETAMQELIDAGIYDADGKLNKRYR